MTDNPDRDEVGVHRIDGRSIDALVERSLDLLRRTYHPGAGDDGGWYHRLDAPSPGPSATASGMSSFLLHGLRFEYEQQCLRFLHKRQISSDDPLLDGGWAINTSYGQPVTEASALVGRLLVTTGTFLAEGAPDARRAAAWLASNQNEDGGWGSFRGQESRVWLTAMAVRALGELDPRSKGLIRGVQWLIKARDPSSHGWGERVGHAATITHTSYVLTALVDSRLTPSDRTVTEALTDGFAWLTSHLDPTKVHDDHARLESYNVIGTSVDGRTVMWENTIWHHGLPFAVSALVRQPGAVRFDLLATAVGTLVTTQTSDGRWPSVDSSAAFSVWTVCPFVDALADVKAHLPLHSAQVLTPLSAEAAVVQGGSDVEVPPPRLLAAVRWRSRRRWLRRHWAAITLVFMLAIGGTLIVTKIFQAHEVGFGLFVPVVLLVIQLAMTSGRSAKQ